MKTSIAELLDRITDEYQKHMLANLSKSESGSGSASSKVKKSLLKRALGIFKSK